MTEKHPYWIKWSTDSAAKFRLHWPWWNTGSHMQFSVAARTRDNYCAAVKATSEDEARRIIWRSYDDIPDSLRFWFCERKKLLWEPFSEEFPRAVWMDWPMTFEEALFKLVLAQFIDEPCKVCGEPMKLEDLLRMAGKGVLALIHERCWTIKGHCPCCDQDFATNRGSYSDDKPYNGRCPACRQAVT